MKQGNEQKKGVTAAYSEARKKGWSSKKEKGVKAFHRIGSFFGHSTRINNSRTSVSLTIRRTRK
jgi:hypothetical protein